VWLDASDAISIFKDNNYRVTQWNDKSGNENNFVNTTGNYPTYLYPRQSFSNRRCISFKRQFLTNSTIYQNTTASNGYTLFFVGKMNSLFGTVFSNDFYQTPNVNVSFNDPYALNVKQGTVTTGNSISYNLTGYSLFSVTLSGSANAIITADSLVIQRDKQNYVYPDYTPYPAYIGNDSLNNLAQNMEISELILYGAPLNFSNILKVKTYLINKWNLTLQSN